MSESDGLHLELIAERPIVRDDMPMDVDIAFDLKTMTAAGESSAPSYSINLCVVIDRSASMSANGKLEHAKRSCIEILDSLGERDNFTVLAFDDEVVSVANPQTPRNEIRERISGLRPGTNTNLANGWYLGLLELQTYATDQHINRLLLLSDGQANRGELKASALGAESGRARDEFGIATSTIGIGEDFEEDILSAISHQSGGRFWYIGDAAIEEIIREEFRGALSVLLERPSVEISLPPGVTIERELNDLPKVAGRYRLRPVKANDHYGFAVRLRVDPSVASTATLPVTATLLDGTQPVEECSLSLRLGSVEEYVRSPEDPRVAMTSARFLTAEADERMVEEMDAGNVTTMITMLQSQSSLMNELERKLAGAGAVSWESMSDRERLAREAELARIQREAAENEALDVVVQLTNLALGLNEPDLVSRLMLGSRKSMRRRSMENRNHYARSDMDDWGVRQQLLRAQAIGLTLKDKYPDLNDELAPILGSIDEHLAKFS
ncbi:vWA domain-containing protein [Nocardia asteroides]